MDKQDLIDKLVDELKGIWPAHWVTAVYDVKSGLFSSWPPRREADLLVHICTDEEFELRAKELGWVNGYKWGVEYQTNGKKPDLQKDLRFKVTGKMIGGHAYQGEFVVDECDWSDAITFCITDPRYKPISKSEPEMSKECPNDFPFIGCLAEHINWGMPIKIKFLGERFFIAEKTDASTGKDGEVCGFIGDLHPIKSEREKFVVAAINAVSNGRVWQMSNQDAAALYDAGFKAPDEKSGK